MMRSLVAETGRLHCKAPGEGSNSYPLEPYLVPLCHNTKSNIFIGRMPLSG